MILHHTHLGRMERTLKKKIIFLIIAMIAVCMTSCGKEAVEPESDALVVSREELDTTGEVKETEDVKKAYVQPEMKGEININVYESSEWLETAASMFTKKYPDMKVNIHDFFNGTDVLINTGSGETAIARPSGQTREDYISQLNTEILSGEADDIIITSIGLPIERYIKMGIFEDLSSYLEGAEEINDSNYYMNIFDACKTEKGALYQFPISAFAVPTVRFDKKLIENTGIGPAPNTTAISFREALELGKQMYDASTLPNTFLGAGDAKNMIGDIYTKTVISSINYDTGEVELDKEKIKEYLTIIEELKAYKFVPSDFDLLNEECHIPSSIQYTQDIEAAAFMLQGENATFQWKSDDGKVYLSPYFALDFGITSQSKNKELSWEFLKFLVSEEVQTLPTCPWSGVHKSGLKARVEGYLTTAGYAQEDAQKIVSTVEGWVLQINAYRPENTDLIQISEGTLNEYAEGKTTAEETINNLISRLEQYMNE